MGDPFLGALNIRCRIIMGIQKGTIIVQPPMHVYIYIYTYIHIHVSHKAVPEQTVVEISGKSAASSLSACNMHDLVSRV